MASTRVKLDASIIAMLEKIKNEDYYLVRTHGYSKTIRDLAKFKLEYKSMEALLEKKMQEYHSDLANHERELLVAVDSIPDKIFRALGSLIKSIMVRDGT